MKTAVVLEVDYPHPPERVWRALTDREALSDWLMPNNFEPRPGHKFQFWSPPRPDWNGIVECEVIELDEPRRLSYTWQSEPDQPPTLVTWTLEPTDKGTRVRLEHQADELPCSLAMASLHSGGWERALGVELPEILRRIRAAAELRARKPLSLVWVYPCWVFDRPVEESRHRHAASVVALPRRAGREEVAARSSTTPAWRKPG